LRQKNILLAWIRFPTLAPEELEEMAVQMLDHVLMLALGADPRASHMLTVGTCRQPTVEEAVLAATA
jgi:hypothetical protein